MIDQGEYWRKARKDMAAAQNRASERILGLILEAEGKIGSRVEGIRYDPHDSTLRVQWDDGIHISLVEKPTA